MSKQNDIYKEAITSKWLTIIISILPATFLFVFLYQMFAGPIGTKPAPNWIFVFLAFLTLGIILNFHKLEARINSRYLQVRYGIIKRTIYWQNIKSVYLDEAPTIIYGGWGIRLTIFKGKWRLAYIVPGSPRLVVALKNGGFREFVFSTRKPEEVIKILEKCCN